MSEQSRWGTCITHRGRDAETFLSHLLAEPHRQASLIAGAGFDPRSMEICERIAETMGSRARALFIREERPNPLPALTDEAARHHELMVARIPNCRSVEVGIFADDNAVIGGRQIISAAAEAGFLGVTDVVVDFSALSKGVTFPLVRWLLEQVDRGRAGFNVHLMVTDAPHIDDHIHSSACDTPSLIHGFRGGWGLEEHQDAAVLWLPLLAKGQRSILETIHGFVKPHDVCPILPLSAQRPRLGDELIEHYMEEFESGWSVDARNILYAMEGNPLDLYRTLIRIDDGRRRVFRETGGSLMVISPLGSKALAIGALMAAIERDLPLVYVEAVSYTMDAPAAREQQSGGEVVHVWLCGEAYTSSGYGSKVD